MAMLNNQRVYGLWMFMVIPPSLEILYNGLFKIPLSGMIWVNYSIVNKQTNKHNSSIWANNNNSLK